MNLLFLFLVHSKLLVIALDSHYLEIPQLMKELSLLLLYLLPIIPIIIVLLLIKMVNKLLLI